MSAIKRFKVALWVLFFGGMFHYNGHYVALISKHSVNFGIKLVADFVLKTLRPRSHISGYFLIRNVFFAD